MKIRRERTEKEKKIWKCWTPMNAHSLLIQSVIQLHLLIHKQSILIGKNRHYFWFQLRDLSPAGEGDMQGFLIKKKNEEKNGDQYVKLLMWKPRDSVMADGRETSDSFDNWKTPCEPRRILRERRMQRSMIDIYYELISVLGYTVWSDIVYTSLYFSLDIHQKSLKTND